MSEVLKLCGMALCCAFCAVILRQFKGETALLVRLGGAVLIFGVALLLMSGIFDRLFGIIDRSSVDPYVTVLMKALGIALTTKICADVCRDCGEATIAGGLELGGKLSILALCLPLMEELMHYVVEFLKL